MPRSPRGVTLIEIAIALAVIALVLGAATTAVRGRLQAARVQEVGETLEAIRQAAAGAYRATGAWPASVEALRPLWLPPTFENRNPWGVPYTLTASGRAAEVTTAIPRGFQTGDFARPSAPGWTLVGVHVVGPVPLVELMFETRRVEGPCDLTNC